MEYVVVVPYASLTEQKSLESFLNDFRHKNMTDFGDRKGTLNMETRDKHKDKAD